MLSSGISLAPDENQNSKDTIKNLNPIYDIKPVSKVNAGSTRKFRTHRMRKGKGDCWSNSVILYNNLKRSGKRARIVQYRTSLSPRHRSVQIYRDGRWVDFNYRGNGYSQTYNATRFKPGMHVIR